MHALTIAALLLANVASAAPDLLIHNATIITINSAAPRATALAVDDGRFIAVGSLDEVLSTIHADPAAASNPAALASAATTIIDAAGRTITPGFHDAHIHPSPAYDEFGPLGTVQCGPDTCPTIDALVERLAKKAAATPAGVWIRGRGFQETKLGRHPTRDDLDRASTTHPIIIRHSSGHLSCANSLALQLAGITNDTKDPPGGALDRDPTGRPTGLLRESAAGLVTRVSASAAKASEDEETEALLRCFDAYLAQGLTSITVAGTGQGSLADYRRTHAARPTVRITVMLQADDVDDLAHMVQSSGRGDDWIRIGSVKLFHGNSLSGQTCWLSEPYVGRPDYFGIPPKRSQADLNALIARVHNAGLQACTHANGDREIAMLLDAVEQANLSNPRPDHRHRIEHGSVMTQALLERTKALGLVLAPHSYIDEHGDKMEPYGEHRWPMMHPARSALDLGIPIAGNSDSPVSAAKPLVRIQDMVLRTSAEGKVYGPEQRISAEEAIAAWTLGSAFASFEEHMKGSIEPGKLADFVILQADPTAAAPSTIKDIQITDTYVAGRRVWPATR